MNDMLRATRRDSWVPALVIAAAVLYQVLVWFAWYPLAGYDDTTLLVAQIGFAALAIVLLPSLRLHREHLGLDGFDLLRALGGIALA